jgi:peptidoglycan hydrolase FlgJ
MTASVDMQAAMAIAKSAPIQAPQQTTDAVAAKKAATAFEGVFLSQFLGQMFDGISTDGPFGGGQGESMFRSLMLDEYGKQIAAQGGIGLASVVTQELLKTQEVRQ